jgi:hypothetical protein
MIRAMVVAAIATFSAGCSYKAEVAAVPSYNVTSSYGQQVPGTWLLYVEGSKLDRPTKTSNFACSAHKFPLAVSGSFRTSTIQTLDNVVEQVLVVDSPVDGPGIRARGAVGQIIVRGEEVRPRMEVKPGFWTAAMDTQATVIASVTVDGLSGRVFGQTVEGQGFSNGDAGMACEGGAKALAEATGQGMGDVMRKIGEAVSNSDRIRAAAGA